MKDVEKIIKRMNLPVEFEHIVFGWLVCHIKIKESTGLTKKMLIKLKDSQFELLKHYTSEVEQEQMMYRIRRELRKIKDEQQQELEQARVYD